MKMVKKQTLKNKQLAMSMGEPRKMVYFHNDKDIKLAVEWLKVAIRSNMLKLKREKAYTIIEDSKLWSLINKKINEAFEDVMVEKNVSKQKVIK